MAADVVGSRGRTRVDGATLRARFGLYDTLGVLHVDQDRQGAEAAGAGRPADAGDPGTGGTSPGAAARAPPGGRPARLGHARAARGAPRSAPAPRRRPLGTIGTARAGAGGRYEAAVAAAGTYRVRYRGDAGPAVRIG